MRECHSKKSYFQIFLNYDILTHRENFRHHKPRMLTTHHYLLAPRQSNGKLGHHVFRLILLDNGTLNSCDFRKHRIQ